MYFLKDGNALTIADLDNMACKLSIAQGRTTGARIISLAPIVNQPYDSPFFQQWRRFVIDDLVIDCIARMAIESNA
jgi:hypothetical protein